MISSNLNFQWPLAIFSSNTHFTRDEWKETTSEKQQEKKYNVLVKQTRQVRAALLMASSRLINVSFDINYNFLI